MSLKETSECFASELERAATWAKQILEAQKAPTK
jgi:hypothetical protein